MGNSLRKMLGIAVLAGIVAGTLSADAATMFSAKYKFGMTGSPVPAGYTLVTPDNLYKKVFRHNYTTGTTMTPEDSTLLRLGYSFVDTVVGYYGFENWKHNTIGAVYRGGSGINSGFITNYIGADSLSSVFNGNSPAYFSVNVPEGKYQVKVTFGDLKDTAITTIKAESRRLIVKDKRTNPGEFLTKTFTVIKRNPDIKNSAGVVIGTVGLNYSYGREDPRICLNWDNKLTLEFNGKRACISAVEIQQLPDTSGITFHLCGNSTIVEQEDEPWTCWGQMMHAFFGPNVFFNDLGSSGLKASSFFSQKRLAKIASMTHPGDYIVFEFGHNESSTSEFTTYMKTYMDSATAHGATMLFVAPTARKAENDSATAVGGYAQLTRTNAKTLNAKCIDLTTAVIKIKTALGSNIAALYCTVSASQLWPEQAAVNDGTHFSDYGSYELAKWMAIKGFRSVNLPVTQYMVDSTDTFNVNAPENPTTWHIPFSIDTIYRHPATLVRPDIKDSAFSTVSIVNSVEALKLPEQSVGINMITHSISYVVTERGAAEFVIFSMSGQKLLQRKTALAAHAGTFQWNELGQLPVGSYILQMKVNNRESARTSFTKL